MDVPPLAFAADVTCRDVVLVVLVWFVPIVVARRGEAPAVVSRPHSDFEGDEELADPVSPRSLSLSRLPGG